jgi:hypothetical protein
VSARRRAGLIFGTLKRGVYEAVAPNVAESGVRIRIECVSNHHVVFE